MGFCWIGNLFFVAYAGFLVCHSRTSEYSTSDQKSELEQVATLLGPASEATKMQYVLADLKRYDTLAAWDPSQTKLLDTNMFAQTLVILVFV